MLGIIVFTTWAILPFAVWFPARVGTPGEPHDSAVVVVGVMAASVIAMASIASQLRGSARIRLLRNVVVIAAISTVASFLLGLDIRFPKVEIPTPHVLATALGVDGESAYEADVFEIYCELWLCVAGIVGTVIFVGLRMSKRAARRPADDTRSL